MNSMPIIDMGNICFKKNGKYIMDSPCASVMVESESELSEWTDKVAPGSIAFTSGFESVWQLGIDGTWSAVLSAS